jgi:hypothetical protein
MNYLLKGQMDFKPTFSTTVVKLSSNHHLQGRKMNEYGKAFQIIWDIISILIIIGMLVMLFIPRSLILSNLPVCQSQSILHKPCFMCGMSRSLIQIAHGHFREASTLNQWSFPFSLLLLWNEVLWLLKKTVGLSMKG